MLAPGCGGSSATCAPALAPLGIAYVAVRYLLLATGVRKPYYAAPFLPACSPRLDPVRALAVDARQVALAACLMGSAAVAAVIALPVLPADRLGSTPIADLNEDAIETVGWPSSSAPLDAFDSLPDRRTGDRRVHRELRRGGRRRSLRAEHGIRRAYSGHNAYARFGTARTAGP